MGSPLVSVVVPTYNRAHLIGRTIESLIAQTYQALEILVVDDGSTDDTREQIARRFGEDARVRYFHKENGGPASARNFGFTQARGEYVALLDSDDTWFPWKLSVQIRCMERYPELGMTWTDMEMIDASGNVMNVKYLRKMYGAYREFTNADIFTQSIPLRDITPDLADVVGDECLRTGMIFPKIFMGNLVHTSTTVLRRERLERVKGFDESLRYSGEDYDFHLRTCREGPVGLIDLPAIRYQQGLPDQLTAKRFRIHMAENLLRTVEGAAARDHASIDLGEGAIRRKLAQAHAWVAAERLDLGETGLARKHYIESLRQRPWQPGLAKGLIFAAFPWGVGVELRESLRRIRARWRGEPDRVQQ